MYLERFWNSLIAPSPEATFRCALLFFSIQFLGALRTTEMATPIPDSFSVDAKPYPYTFPRNGTALLVIDMQRDFLMLNGFGEIEGGDLTAVQAAIEPARRLLEACRAAGLAVFHTREGQKSDMSDCPASKTHRPAAAPLTQYVTGIGDRGKMGRMLIRGEYGHDFVDELKPRPGEVVIDKPGKGAFWQTDIMYKLKAHAITHLIICGVTTECCVATTFREANDRGFECCKSLALSFSSFCI